MRKRTLSAIVLLLIGSSLPTVAARGEAGEVELGVYVGETFPDDYEPFEPGDDLLAGARIGWFFSPTWSLELSGQMFSSETEFDGAAPDVDFEIQSYRINALRNFRPGQALRPFATIGIGPELTDVDGLDHAKDIGANLGGGLRWYFAERLGLRFDGRYVTTSVGQQVDHRENNFEATVGVLFTFGGKPARAEQAAVVKETPKKSPKDTDGDGVTDDLDKCPDTSRGVAVNRAGCPKDSDADGVLDGVDKCPNTPHGGKVDATGCSADTDGDGVPDDLDRCPGTPAGKKVDGKGCEVLFDEGKESLVLEGVTFEFGSDKLTASSEAILDRVAMSLREWPEVKVEVAGHTDSVGNDAFNQGLSERRAASVRAYLVKQGVAASRLQSRGFGEIKPVADNDSDAGRAKNRRVELHKR